MSARIFVTGGSGFVGTRLLATLKDRGYPIVALDRSGTLSQQQLAPGGSVVTGDLLDPASYRDALQTCDTVLHLAAATGRVPSKEHDRVNARGTEVLLDECRKAGVRNLLFVSSIAVKFPRTAAYPYARTKSRAEDAVRRSGLRFTIVRPTMVLGAGAPVLAALERLVGLPITVVPGSGRVRVQPVHVDDLVEAILEVVQRDRFENQSVEIGGPEALTVEELLRRLRVARRGSTGPVVRLPLNLLQIPLAWAESLGLSRALPVSAGQLSSFRFDGLAAPAGTGEMPATPAIPVSRMIDGPVRSHAARLDAECRVFTRYLVGRHPDEYVTAKYAAAHATLPALAPTDAFDRTLAACARLGPVCAKVADSYARVLSPDAALRKRLVVLLAILETRPPFHEVIDSPVTGSTTLVLAKMAATMAAAIAAMVAGALVFVPVRLVLAFTSRRRV